jgi:hypothetical protein
MMVALYILGGIVALLIVLALLAPKETNLSHTIEVSKSKDKVYEDLRSLETFVKWSPWEGRDPTLEFGFKGIDGEVGSQYWWKGNKQVGEGEQEITALTPGEKVSMELRFLKPWKSEADTWFDLEGEPDGSETKVTWAFRSQNKLPGSIFMLFMNMEKMLGGDYQKGLNQYKAYVEK